MASAGIRKNRNGTRYQVWWRLDDGTQGSKTFDSRALARDFKHELLAQAAANAWVDPRRGRLLFDDWADHWWRLWSSSPRRSPKGMETTDSHLRCHLRPSFGRRQLRQITPSSILRWQHDLEQRLSHSGVMACRSILLRILDAARKEHLLAANPVREVEAPKPRLDPDQVFGHQRRRTLTPEELGHLLAACRPFYRDHFLIQAGTCRPPTGGGSTRPPSRQPAPISPISTCAVRMTCAIPSRPGWRTPPSPRGSSMS
jgi:hypothetical protein